MPLTFKRSCDEAFLILFTDPKWFRSNFLRFLPTPDIGFDDGTSGGGTSTGTTGGGLK